MPWQAARLRLSFPAPATYMVPTMNVAGKGRHTYPDGTYFEGEWLEGGRVRGKLVAGDGSSEYTGGWRGDQRHGHGVLFQVCVEGAGWGRGQAKRREGFGWAGGGSEHKKDCTNI